MTALRSRSPIKGISSKAGALGRHNCRRMLHQNRLSVRANPGRALGPERPNTIEPLFGHGAESPEPRVVRRANLISEPEIAE
jgi:hypothetical protein